MRMGRGATDLKAPPASGVVVGRQPAVCVSRGVGPFVEEVLPRANRAPEQKVSQAARCADEPQPGLLEWDLIFQERAGSARAGGLASKKVKDRSGMKRATPALLLRLSPGSRPVSRQGSWPKPWKHPGNGMTDGASFFPPPSGQARSIKTPYRSNGEVAFRPALAQVGKSRSLANDCRVPMGQRRRSNR